MELLEDVLNLEHILVPLSGRGLLSGIGLALKTNSPEIQIIGVSMEKSAVMHESIKVGKPRELDESDTLADSLRGGIGLNNQ